MVLQNNVILVNGQPARMHFSADRLEKRTITDPQTGHPTIRNILVLDVDELGGQKVQSTFSTMAEKLASLIGPYLAGKKYLAYDFVITQSGEGYLRGWSVQVLPRA